MDQVAIVGGIAVAISASEVTWESGYRVDADGSPRAYSPWGSGLPALDNLRNAMHRIDDDPHNPEHGWVGIVTDPLGKPVIQGPGDPAPGYYVSPTALTDRSKGIGDPRRYVDASTVPYVTVPQVLLRKGVMLGDVGLIACRGTGLSYPAIVGDVGPRPGEGSVYLAERLGIPSNARNGGCERGVIFRIFLGTAANPPWPRTMESIQSAVDARSSRD